MNETTYNLVPAPIDTLHAELRSLIASSCQRLAGAVNAELTRLYWNVGQRLRTEVLGEGRASYRAQLLDQLGQQLTQEFGRGFESRNLRRMVKFAESFPDAAIVSTLSTQLSWGHMVAIVALKSPQARQFYAQHAAQDGWSVRELNHQIDRKAFERTELAALQTNTRVQAEHVEIAHTSPALVFQDPGRYWGLAIQHGDERFFLMSLKSLVMQRCWIASCCFARPDPIFPSGSQGHHCRCDAQAGAPDLWSAQNTPAV